MVEHGTENAGVDSSSLSLGTSAPSKGGSGSVVEHLLAKERVEGSNPFFRSNLNQTKSPGAGGFFLWPFQGGELDREPMESLDRSVLD